jgi:thiamine-monophosphate kinase
VDEGLKALGEFGIIGLFRQEASPSRKWVVCGIGDDCAVLNAGGNERLLVTTDMLMEKVHFLRQVISPYRLGYKAMAVNISDIAAMGGEPTAAFLAMALTPDLGEDFLRDFRHGLLACARAHEVDLLGGDTSSARNDIALCLTVLGRASEEEVVRRSGARPGDRIFLGGPVGDSAAGLHLILGESRADSSEDNEALLKAHMQPVPQVELGRCLATGKLATAMIDVSDGVLQDLSHICAESRVGAELDADKLPISDAARRLAARDGLDPRDWALSGGEDYVLMFCVPEEKQAQMQAVCSRELGLMLDAVGEITAGRTIRVCRDGNWSDAPPAGYDHFKKEPSGGTP